MIKNTVEIKSMKKNFQSESIHDLIMEHLQAGVPEACRRFEAKSGKFTWKEGGSHSLLRMQDVIVSLALLYTADVPSNHMYGKKSVLKMAVGVGDSLRRSQDAQGRFTGDTKADGSVFAGAGYSPWTIYYWLEAYVLLKEHLTPACRRRWEKGLRLCMTGMEKELHTRWHGRVHNIANWMAMTLVRAAQVFNNAKWRKLGSKICQLTARDQHPDGYWAEGGGPINGYNLTYVHALGLYYYFTRDASMLPVLKRALRFHLDFTYPDGTRVETVDGRQRFIDHEPVHAWLGSGVGWPGFDISDKGRGLIQMCIDGLRQRWPAGNIAPALATSWLFVSRGPIEAAAQTQQHHYSAYPVKKPRSIVRRSGPWFICLSGYVTPPDERHRHAMNRWAMDRTQHLSIWHEKLGLVVGGGNSKNDPDRSAFLVWSDNNCLRMADSTELKTLSSHADQLKLRYGKIECTLTVKVLSSKKIEIFCAGPDKGRYTASAAFTMPFKKGWKINDSNNKAYNEIDPMRAWTAAWSKKSGNWFGSDLFKVTMPSVAQVQWPSYPFNPYALTGTASGSQAVARLSTDISSGQGQKKFVIQIN